MLTEISISVAIGLLILVTYLMRLTIKQKRNLDRFLGKKFSFGLLLVLLLFYASAVLSAETVEYYPTDMGNIWVLETEDKTERVTYTIETTEERFNGRDTFVLKRTAETLGADESTGEVYFVHLDQAGIKLHKIVAELGSVFGTATAVFSPPALFLPASLELGDSWGITLETEVVLTGTVLVSYVYEVVAVENVTTPAGIFENCLKIQLKARTTSRLGVGRSTSYQWLAPNVGTVRVETDQEIVFNLVSSNLLTDASIYDVTGDGIVNILDLVFVASRFGDVSEDADVNGDGGVNILDLTLIAQNFSN